MTDVKRGVTESWTVEKPPRDLVQCPICGRPMDWGFCYIAELADGGLVEDIAYRCDSLKGGCEAILRPPVQFIDGRLDLPGEDAN